MAKIILLKWIWWDMILFKWIGEKDSLWGTGVDVIYAAAKKTTGTERGDVVYMVGKILIL